MAALSIIVPTYHEAENLPELVGRISSVVSGVGIETEIVIVDDNSQDGTDRVCKEISQRHPVRLITRRHARGLATAVLHGIKESKNDYIIVMDADLSHPPEKISVMVKSLQGGGRFCRRIASQGTRFPGRPTSSRIERMSVIFTRQHSVSPCVPYRCMS
ncbi:MAG: glycosyltransferase [Nitrospiraceae bacterium]